MKKQFIPGKIYSVTSICDSDCHFKFEVIRRTEKSVWLKDLSGIKKGIYRVKITDCLNDAETCSALGSFSMSPLLRA